MLKTSNDGIVKQVVNGTFGDGVTYYYYFDMLGSGFNMFSMYYEIQNTTVSWEAHDGSVWADVTNFLSDGAVSSVTSSGMLTAAAPVPYARMRVKAVTTNATNALTLSMSRMRV